METPKIERLPPVTIEFLRVVNGVEAARLCCEDCKVVHVLSWERLGLPDDTPFPPPGRLWKCDRCGGTNVTATPEWHAETQSPKVAPIEQTAEATYASGEGVEGEVAAETSVRNQWDLLAVRFRRPPAAARPLAPPSAPAIDPPVANIKR